MSNLTLNEKIEMILKDLENDETVEILTDRGDMICKKEVNGYSFSTDGMMRGNGKNVGIETIKDRLKIYLNRITISRF